MQLLIVLRDIKSTKPNIKKIGTAIDVERKVMTKETAESWVMKGKSLKENNLLLKN